MSYYDKYKKLTEAEEAERESILHPEGSDGIFRGGISHYSGLTPDRMRILLEKGYALEDESHNDCPSIGECVEFCERHPGFTMHGYSVSRERNDCRVSVEGVEGEPGCLDEAGLQDFVDVFRFADDFCIGGKNESYYCWFD